MVALAICSILLLWVQHAAVEAAAVGLFGRRVVGAGEQGGGVALRGEVVVWSVVCVPYRLASLYPLIASRIRRESKFGGKQN